MLNREALCGCLLDRRQVAAQLSPKFVYNGGIVGFVMKATIETRFRIITTFVCTWKG